MYFHGHLHKKPGFNCLCRSGHSCCVVNPGAAMYVLRQENELQGKETRRGDTLEGEGEMASVGGQTHTERNVALFVTQARGVHNLCNCFESGEIMLARHCAKRWSQQISTFSKLFTRSSTRSYSGMFFARTWTVVYSYGCGSIGCLGHNDFEDREYPTVCTPLFV